MKNFIIIWPNSTIENETVERVMNTFTDSWERYDINIPNTFSFYEKLYQLPIALSENKLKQCGFGHASMYVFSASKSNFMYRPSFSEIKKCDTIAFDIKFLFRLIDKKNLVHGSTDESEFSSDLQYLSQFINKDNTDFIIPFKFSAFKEVWLRRSKSFFGKFGPRLRYSAQIMESRVEFLFFSILSKLYKKNIKPIYKNKWRWGSRYFRIYSRKGNKYFVKTFNRYEADMDEFLILRSLSLNSSYPRGLLECIFFNKRSLIQSWKNYRNINKKDMSNPKIQQELIALIRNLYAQGIAHRDIKTDNLLLDRDSNKISLIDFGHGIKFNSLNASKSECTKIFNHQRWDDGFSVMKMVFEVLGEDICNFPDFYFELSKNSGRTAITEDGKILT